MEHVIQTRSLTKHYKDVVAVSHLDMDIKAGEIYGFLGLNGAGKTTTIRMLLGLIKASFGSVYINGSKTNSGSSSVLTQVGSLVEMPHAYPNLTVVENLDIVRRLRSLKNKHAVTDIIQRLELGKYAHRKAKNLSLGNAQRLGLAKALMHQPDILILDEPVNGLDPEGIHDIRELLKSLARERGVTIFISSHLLGEISLLANRIGIIHEGCLISEFNSSELNERSAKYVRVRTVDNKKAIHVLNKNGYLKCDAITGEIRIDDGQAVLSPSKIASVLVHAGLPPSLLVVEEENLESYFLRVIKQEEGII